MAPPRRFQGRLPLVEALSFFSSLTAGSCRLHIASALGQEPVYPGAEQLLEARTTTASH